MAYSRLRIVDRRTHLDDLLLEATYDKNLICGSKLVSAFELMYVVLHRITDDLDSVLPPDVSVHQQSARTAINRVNLMLHKPPYASGIPDLLSRLPIHFWRDNEGWLGPAEILEIR